MNIILYLIIFAMGITFGSFCTLAVYRIPLRENILNKRSFCVECEHKLSFWDMIPVLSYLALGGKCRYCGKKIRPRYFILEICAGLVFVLFAFSFQLNIYSFQIDKYMYLFFGMLYFTGLFILAGIDKEKVRVENSLLIYLTIVNAVYMIYLYIVEHASMYRYVMYLVIICVLVAINTYYLHKKAKNNYTVGVLILSMLMILFSYEGQFVFTVILTLLSIAFDILLQKLKQSRKKCKKVNAKDKVNVPIAFYLCISNVMVVILTNIYYIYRWGIC